jgi:hypothetical protein
MCPQVTTYAEDGTEEFRLDYLDASYLKIRQVVKYRVYVVTEDMSSHPELIAYKFYNTTDLWWAICLFNDIIDPVTELYSGVSIRIPDLAEMSPLIQTKTEALNSTKIIMVN